MADWVFWMQVNVRQLMVFHTIWSKGLIAGGFNAIIRAAEFAEDDTEQGWLDLQSKNISDKDFVIGIAASGTTPYVIGALQHCKKNNIDTGCITCN